MIARVEEPFYDAISRMSFCLFLLLGAATNTALFGSCSQDESKGISQKVKVKLVVKIPALMDTNEKQLGVYVAGNIEALGKWRPDGFKLSSIDATTYQGEFEVEVGTDIEFKLTRGSWKTVEKGALERDIPNRKLKVRSIAVGSTQEVEIVVENWSRSKAREETITGRLDLYPDFLSKYLSEKRNVTVWLPPGYETNSSEVAVLYLQDGQNLFDESSSIFGVEWGVDETLTKWIEMKKIPPLIVVGIWNTKDRLREYTFTSDERLGSGGAGEKYLKFLIEELKPFIDQKYRTLRSPEGTWIGGSSLGGLFSLYASAKRPDVFGSCFAWSPSLHWDRERLLLEAENGALSWSGVDLWLSMGDSEGDSIESRNANVARAEKLIAFVGDSQKVCLLRSKIFKGELGVHRENAWKLQFEVAIAEMLSDKHTK